MPEVSTKYTILVYLVQILCPRWTWRQMHTVAGEIVLPVLFCFSCVGHLEVARRPEALDAVECQSTTSYDVISLQLASLHECQPVDVDALRW